MERGFLLLSAFFFSRAFKEKFFELRIVGVQKFFPLSWNRKNDFPMEKFDAQLLLES
jgi:hypothetical protein